MAVTNQVVTEEWVTFPGGELEGKRPKALCAACREALKRESATYGSSGNARRSRLLCFDCYRADLARARARKAAGELDTASEARFQSSQATARGAGERPVVAAPVRTGWWFKGYEPFWCRIR